MSVLRWSSHFLAAVCLLALYVIFIGEIPRLPLNSPELQNFKTIFISIVLEAFPFILLGVLVSAVLNVFVSEETVRKWVPKNPVPGILFGSLLGLVFPLCECGMIPVIRRLILKGMPVYIGVVYILSGPIINPVVYASTFMAFRSHPEIAYSRMFLAFFVAVVIGALLYVLVRSNPLKQHTHVQHSHDAHHHAGKAFSTLSHASDEFFEMGKYLMFGAMVTAAIHTLLNRESLVSLGEGDIGSHLFMMGFAYILSVCSTSDAFVASSFLTTFSAGSLLTFLVFGPMLDLKNTLMMLAVFKVRFVALLIILIVTVVLGSSLLYEQWLL